MRELIGSLLGPRRPGQDVPPETPTRIPWLQWNHSNVIFIYLFQMQLVRCCYVLCDSLKQRKDALIRLRIYAVEARTSIDSRIRIF